MSMIPPPIETEGSPVSTAADDATEPLPASCQDGFVVVFDAVAPEGSTGNDQRVFEVSGQGSNQERIFVSENSGDLKLVVVVGGDVKINTTIKSAINGERIKVAARCVAGSYAVALNGAVELTDSEPTFPDSMDINVIGTGDQENREWNSSIASLYFDDKTEEWSDADLQNASAL